MKTITRNQSRDLLLFLGLLVLLLVSVPRLRVYYKGTPAKVTLVAVGGDGTRLEMESPEPFQGVQAGLFSTKRLIGDFAETPEAKKLTPAGGHLEWSIHSIDQKEQEKLPLIVITDSLHEDE